MTAYQLSMKKWKNIEEAVAALYPVRNVAESRKKAASLLLEAQTHCSCCKKYKMVCTECPIGKISPCRDKDSVCHELVEALSFVVTKTKCAWPYKMFWDRLGKAKLRFGVSD